MSTSIQMNDVKPSGHARSHSSSSSADDGPNRAHVRPESLSSSIKAAEAEKLIATEGLGPQPLWKRLPSWVPIITWILTSSSVIFLNKWILYDQGFSYPIALTTFHLLFQSTATRILFYNTTLVDGAKLLSSTGKMNRDIYLRKIVPIGVLFSLSLVLSNYVYLRLSLSFIQMLKAFTPVSILLLSFAFRLKEPSQKLFVIVLCISIGVTIASYGEADFDLIGFLVQALAIAIESSRIIMVQIILQEGGLAGMNPIVSLYYFAPICLGLNLLVLPIVEGLQPFFEIYKVGVPILLFNAAMTFALNLSSVWLIGSASGLILTLAGVVKDILLVTVSFVFLGAPITGLQVFGYGIALTGLVLFTMNS